MATMKRDILWARFAPGALLFGLLAGLTSPCARAAAPLAQTDEVAHTVQEGDTLEGLARAYLSSPSQWPLLQRRNKVADPRRLRPGSVLWIPVPLHAESATVQFVHGTVTAHPRPGTASVPVAPGDRLQEGTALQVGDEAFVTVRLADGTLVRVQAQSALQLHQLRRRGRAGSVQSVLEMRRGAVEATVPPSAEPERRMEIRTPMAVTSVRGTHFSVAMAPGGHTTASVLSGSVAVRSRQEVSPGAAVPPESPPALLSPGQGLAVAANGAVGAPRPLLAAPDVSGVPGTFGETGLLAIDLPALPGAAGYLALVARDAELTQVVRHGLFADGLLRWKALDDGRYHLAVRALDEAGIAGTPAVRPLTVKTRPVAPLHQQPAPGAVLARGTGALQCTQVPGVRWYRVQMATDAQFTTPVRDEQRLSECRLSLHDVPAGRYFWRVASLAQTPDGGIDQGPFTRPQPYTVAERPPPLSLAALQSQDGDTHVHLHWPGLAGQRFRLQLTRDTDLAFEDPLQDTVMETPAWSGSNLPAGTYLVRIQVLDATGLDSDFSPPRQIRVGAGLRTGSGLPVTTSGGQPVGPR